MSSTQVREGLKVKATLILLATIITTITVVNQNLTLTTKMPIIAIPTKQTNKTTRNQELGTHHVRPKTN